MKFYFLMGILACINVAAIAQQSPVFAKSIELQDAADADLSFLEDADMIKLTGKLIQPADGYGLVLVDKAIYIFPQSARIGNNGKKKSAQAIYNRFQSMPASDNQKAALENENGGKIILRDVKILTCRSAGCFPCGWEPWEGDKEVLKCTGCDDCEAFASTGSLKISKYTDYQGQLHTL